MGIRVIFSVFAALMVFSCSSDKEGEFQQTVPESVRALVDEPMDLNRLIIQTPPQLISVTSAIECVFREPVVYHQNCSHSMKKR